MTGRRKIKTNLREINRDNVLQMLEDTLAVHMKNAAEIDYLWRYYKGEQDIRHKAKYVRENINEKVCVNRANEIVTFKTAFFLQEPIQYISHGSDSFAKVTRLNEWMRMAGKEAVDKSLIDWMHICGLGERLTLRPDEGAEAPVALYSVDPRNAYVVYHNGITEERMAGVVLGVDEEGNNQADVYTKDTHYLIKGNEVEVVASPQYDGIPLVEYENNMARQGAFEIVIDILNSINTLESNAVDSVVDFVNGFDVFQNCEVDDGNYSQLSIGGKAVQVRTITPGMEAKVYRVASELSQQGVQTRIDNFTDSYLTICGMPNRNGGSSTSDTGTAVILRDGWSEAASRAADTETMYRKADREACKVMLTIFRNLNLDAPRLSEFEPEFPRGNLANAQSKVQVLCEMLNNPKIHPKYAFSVSGLFDDAEEAFKVSNEYYQSYLAEKEKELDDTVDDTRSDFE